ncbi:MAG: U32 family peptidase, partial [Actinobacteria bacterium]|nr:U32 family peptidase [Actinomycetota bacterium]
MTGNKKMELVSPAGGWDQLVAAINAGANAVYLGFKKFGARAYAENFELSQLKKAVRISHENGVKIYLTLNTLIKDGELKEAVLFLEEYLSFCQDGIIIQDLGLYKIIRDVFPGTRVHASTQLNVHNLESLKFLKGAGFARAVLAREMTLEEIRHIRSREPGIELEVFVHGSQCYSYSGNCYFSSFTGSRSGNRGRCTQPCRMKYSFDWIDESTHKNGRILDNCYILSKKDLAALEFIPELAAAGIDALKIEGRMKTAQYVGIVTKVYRKYLDLYYKDTLDFKVDPSDTYKIAQIFSRELGTGYFFNSYPEDIVSLKKSGSVGNFLGRITKIE